MTYRSSNEKYLKRHKNTIPAGRKSSLKICVRFDRYERVMVSLRVPNFQTFQGGSIH